MTKTVLGIFTNRDDAENAINSLEEAGFMAKDISIVMKDNVHADEFAQDTGTNVAGGAVTGAATGAALGGLAGLLIGVGTLAIPGVGGLLIGGPIAAALGITGTAATTISGAATGAVAGGLLGALMGFGIPEEDARYYESRIQEGGILVAVPATTGTFADAQEILQDNGAEQIRTITHPIEEEDVDYDTTHAGAGYHVPDQPAYAHMGTKGGRTRRTRRRARM